MNASRLLEVVQLLINVEKRKKVQETLNSVNTALSNLVSNPSQPSQQNEFAQALEALRKVLSEVRTTFQPAQVKLLEEIGAAEFFTADLAADIAGWTSENVATPAAAQERLGVLISERDAYLTQIRQLRENLVRIGILVDGLEPGQAEIGFLLPRELFENEFEQLLKELGVVKNIIRAFSEVAGSVEPIEVRQISTSDPLFSFGLNPATIALIGGAVTWALNTWKQVEEIRQIRAQAAKITALKDDPIEQLFEDKIKQHVANEVAAHTAKIMENIDEQRGRKNEQETHIKWALNSIISRVERGMTVEVRFLPPPKPKVEEGGEPPPPSPAFEDLGKIANELVFPKIEGAPVLELPPSDPGSATQAAAKNAP
jgi:hypothetical protein